MQCSINQSRVCVVPITDGTTPDVQSYACHEWGHIAPNCSNTATISSSFIMQRMQFIQDRKETGIERSWIF